MPPWVYKLAEDLEDLLWLDSVSVVGIEVVERVMEGGRDA